MLNGKYTTSLKTIFLSLERGKIIFEPEKLSKEFAKRIGAII